MPNAPSGEFAHQKHKRENKSSSGKDVPAHFIRHMNTMCAWHALANGLPHSVKKYNRSTKVREEVTVRPGEGCIRVVQQLIRELPGGLPGGLEDPGDISAASDPTRAMLAGSHQGSARWDATLITSEAGQATTQANTGSWKEVVSTGRFRPGYVEVVKAYRTYYGCGRRSREKSSSDARCPLCWSNALTLEDKTVSCSKFNHTASAKGSSGSGHWKEPQVPPTHRTSGFSGKGLARTWRSTRGSPRTTTTPA
ncbi:unnamed protein product [Ectocarpus sp. 13 AM-2016]